MGTKSDRTAYMATLNLGDVRKRGDVRFMYIFSYKEANSMISQFTDDDLGNGTGVNIHVNHFRIDLGLSRSIQLQNLLFVQDPIAGNRPGFSVLLPKGSNTTFRYQGQLAFSFKINGPSYAARVNPLSRLTYRHPRIEPVHWY